MADQHSTAALRSRARLHPRTWVVFPTLLFLAVLALGTVQAGTIHPALVDQLARLGPGEKATGILILQEQADIPSLNEALKVQPATRAERHQRVVEALQETAARTQGPILAVLETMKSGGEITGYTPYWISNLIVVRGTRSALESLAARMDVDVIEPSPKFALIEPVGGTPKTPQDGGPRGIGVTPGLRAIRADQVWYQLGINGTGALIGGLDTGVDGNHPALHDRWRGNNGHPWQECWLDVLGSGTQYPNDGYGHGTHTMGTMAGLGAATHDTVGVAWGAQWIACNAINQGVGSAFDNDVIAAFQWFADPDGNPNTVDDVPDVVQNSWGINEGFGYGYTDCDSRWWAAIDNCEAASVCVTYSAGNEGPGSQSLRSPADRATTQYNCFSVGAVDATNYNSWPYPIASWSSRGPSGCNVPTPLKIKPEVAAPGVNVYSCVPGSGYQNMSGTSMAGPHVAGVVALMRAASPNIDVDTIKQILMDTARDEGAAGEDNSYGYGFIDAYEAVVHAMTGGQGTIQGTVTNATNGGTPIAGAQVKLVEIGLILTTNAAGQYSGTATPATYTVEVSHPGFATQTVPGIVLQSYQITTQNFALADIAGPAITNVNYSLSAPTPNSPIPVSATITDDSALALKDLIWRVDGGTWSTLGMNPAGINTYQVLIPGQPLGAHIEYYLHATDVGGNATFVPSNGTFFDTFVTQPLFTDDFETDKGWVAFQPGDTPDGRWARWDPYGTQQGGVQCEPANDHTPAPGVMCFDTGVGTQGGPAEGSDVDNGCVTLTSPAINLTGSDGAFVSYWRWFASVGTFTGSYVAQASSDDGATWVDLEGLASTANSWTHVGFNLAGVIGFTSNVRFRFIACATGSTGIVESAIDDFSVDDFPNASSAVSTPAAPAGTLLYDNRPNPFSRETTLRFRLGAEGSALLAVYDPAGRLVRTLRSGPLAAGEHSAQWDGKDDSGNAVSAGIYFYELRTGAEKMQRKMLLVR